LALEQKIAELQLKYEEAEAKNQRAISMAQQTRSGHVYIISNIGSFGEDVYKIGMTRRLEPLDRVRELGDASVPFSFDVHAMIYSDDAPSLENHLHKVFNEKQVNKINSRKEFFNVNLKEIKSVIEDMNINAHWTMFAEAKEYRESLAIEQERKAATSANDELHVA
ncbi:GIY-YIG nuclease family protein, partial [Escherichia coli]|nr:GIY-YIG nuclease family protein [Escherichia coli]